MANQPTVMVIPAMRPPIKPFDRPLLLARCQIPPETSLAGRHPLPHASVMFTVSEAEAAAIRTAFEQGGELSAAVELRRLFPGVADNTEARECARPSPRGSRCRQVSADALDDYAATRSGANHLRYCLGANVCAQMPPRPLRRPITRETASSTTTQETKSRDTRVVGVRR